MYAIAPLYALSAGVPESAIAIRALAPALLFFPLIAIIRGIFARAKHHDCRRHFSGD